MGDMVIVAYRPKSGCDEELLNLVCDHVPLLRRLGLATDRQSHAMKAKDGTIVEIFEWADGAIGKAHQDPQVQELWAQFEKVCDYVPLKDLPEAADMFAEFTPIEF